MRKLSFFFFLNFLHQTFMESHSLTESTCLGVYVITMKIIFFFWKTYRSFEKYNIYIKTHVHTCTAQKTYTLTHIHTLHRNTSKTTDLYTDINAYTPQRHTTNTHRNRNRHRYTYTHTPQKHYRNRHTHTHKHTHQRNTLQKHRRTDTHIYTYTVVYLFPQNWKIFLAR